MLGTMKKASSLAVTTFAIFSAFTTAAPQIDPIGPEPVTLPFKLRVSSSQTVDITSPYLTCSGNTTYNPDLVGYYHFNLPLNSAELRCGNSSNPLIGAPANSVLTIFTGFEAPGSINTAFSIVNDTLVWTNPSFRLDEAQFLLDVNNKMVYAMFFPLPLAYGIWNPVNLVVERLLAKG